MKVLVHGFQTESIPIGRGVKQGDALSCSLFILLMDNVIRALKEDLNKIRVPQGEVDNVIGYADDLAVIVDDKNKIQTVFSTYEKFSKESGLYLNADKIEILNLRNYIDNENTLIRAYDKTFNIKCVDKVKICGKTFSDNTRTEHECNVQTQIKKLEAQLDLWKKRNLTTEGRILISKTFGISQVVYNLQNTVYQMEDLKKIERIIYKYIWKGPDKIKREIIKQDKGWWP
jgi:hypothetical protein